MKRMHIHVSVEDLAESIRFYSAMFGGVEPTVRKDDYCKWELSDPAVNFAISQRLVRSGVDHFGIQVETEEELMEVRNRFALAEIAEDGAVGGEYGYALPDRSWTVDPQGVAWEAFCAREGTPPIGQPRREEAPEASHAALCGPQSAVTIPFRRRR
ncbi:MAG TPA: glyoxalase/bleomycin resistance/dioxygenase family protein [Paraburkholderia sp.]|jgi:catechol 2,3-dioxygenase-like lactoylglutathione lyase family enzyme|nr:glyoxalase/bleomycin resistance/dioxygenase family protein [Paraburkholderia sp.]